MKELEALAPEADDEETLAAEHQLLRADTAIGEAVAQALGDHDGAGLELDAARAVFERLGAVPDLARIDSLAKNGPFIVPMA